MLSNAVKDCEENGVDKENKYYKRGKIILEIPGSPDDIYKLDVVDING